MRCPAGRPRSPPSSEPLAVLPLQLQQEWPQLSKAWGQRIRRSYRTCPLPRMPALLSRRTPSAVLRRVITCLAIAAVERYCWKLNRATPAAPAMVTRLASTNSIAPPRAIALRAGAGKFPICRATSEMTLAIPLMTGVRGSSTLKYIYSIEELSSRNEPPMLSSIFLAIVSTALMPLCPELCS